MHERVDDSPAEEAGEEAVAIADPAEELAAALTRAEEYREAWQRSHADFANYRRRTEAERSEMATFANAALLGKLLPVADDFDLALANVPAEAADTPWVRGILLIQRKLLQLLESEGVTPITALGQPFEPSLHEAVMLEEGASPPHVVAAELRRGYRLGERVLRPTLVRVGGQPQPTSENENQEEG